MDIYLYAKMDTKISCFDDIVDLFPNSPITITIENRRSFRNFNNLMRKISSDSMVVVNDYTDLGNNATDIINRLNWFLENDCLLVIKNVPSTYYYGVLLSTNKAVLQTLIQTIQKNNVLILPKKISVGRNKIDFPDNWDELYEQWEKNKISSKEFLQKSGLKKATFYNLVTEYKAVKQANENYIKHYKKA